MNNKGVFLKILVVVICLLAVTVFALNASGNAPRFLTKGIDKICSILHIPQDKIAHNTPAHETDSENAEEPVDLKNLPTAFPVAENTLFKRYDKGIICVNATLYAKYSHDASPEWIESIQMQEPILAVKGDYVLISETGAKKMSLYKGKRHIYTVETEGNIYTADLSEKGDVIAVTEKEYFKGQVVVFNRSGKRIFAWDSGSYSILDAAISNGRKIGISLLSTDEGASSIIQIFDVNGKELAKTDAFRDTVFFSIDFNGEELALLSENRYIGMNKKGETKWKYDFEGRKIMKSSRDARGTRAILFDNDGVGEIVVVTAKGRAYQPIKTQIMPDTVDINLKSVAYNNGRTAIITGYDGKRVLTAECASDIKQIYITAEDKVFCVYSTAVQEKKLKK